jgi:hypothetical protein
MLRSLDEDSGLRSPQSGQTKRMQAADSFCGMPKFRITSAPQSSDAKKSWMRIIGSLSDCLLSNAETAPNLSRQTSAFLNLFRAHICVQCSNDQSRRAAKNPGCARSADRNPRPAARPMPTKRGFSGACPAQSGAAV